MELFFLWLSVAIIFFFIELMGVSFFFFLSFALGAFVTALFSLWSVCLAYQALVFLTSSAASFAVLRVFFNPRNYHVHATNVDRLPGMRGVVTQTIAPGISGQVKIEGQVWSARAINTDIIVENTMVEVVRVQGCHVIVRPITKG
jgi:membrane protein implicated in regulation of membrane protease activity